MKIMILSDNFYPNFDGGATIIAYNLAVGLKKAGHLVYVITTVRAKEEEGVFDVDGIEVFRIRTEYDLRLRAYLSIFNYQVIHKVRSIIKKIKPDIINAHNIHLYLSYYSLKLAYKSGAKVVLTAHDVMSFNYGKFDSFINKTDLKIPIKFNYKINIFEQIKTLKTRYNPLRNILIRYFIRNYVNRVVAVSFALKDALMDNGIDNVDVIHNGIDLNSWTIVDSKINNFKNRFGIKNKKVVMFAGRLTDAKGALQLLESFNLVLGKVRDTLLLVVGPKDSYVDKMLKIANSLNIKDNIVFTDTLWGDDLIAAYVASDVVVVPSVCFDSFPTVILEAMSTKKPVVATCFGGAREVVDDGVTGYIVNPFDIKSMSEKIIEILINFHYATNFGELGYRKLLKTLTIDKQIGRYIGLFHSL